MDFRSFSTIPAPATPFLLPGVITYLPRRCWNEEEGRRDRDRRSVQQSHSELHDRLWWTSDRDLSGLLLHYNTVGGGLRSSRGEETALPALEWWRNDGNPYGRPHLIILVNHYETVSPPGLLQPNSIPDSAWTNISMDFIDGLPNSEGYTGTKLDKSSAYHPQTDGQAENLNRTLEQYLRCTVREMPHKWVQALAWAEWWYNTAYHSSIKMCLSIVGIFRSKTRDLDTSRDSMSSRDPLFQFVWDSTVHGEVELETDCSILGIDSLSVRVRIRRYSGMMRGGGHQVSKCHVPLSGVSSWATLVVKLHGYAGLRSKIKECKGIRAVPLEFRQADPVEFGELVASRGLNAEEGTRPSLHKLVGVWSRSLDEPKAGRNQSLSRLIRLALWHGSAAWAKCGGQRARPVTNGIRAASAIVVRWSASAHTCRRVPRVESPRGRGRVGRVPQRLGFGL
ncbi:hypothetical protein ACLB2K_011706 [Fragaria x ananassa]